MLDRFDLYTLCAQAPEQEARFLHALHGGGPKLLRDDFAGPGAIARAWAGLVAGGRAIAVDLDSEPLMRCRGTPGVTVRRSDATRTRIRADVIAAFNFAACELHSREELLRYFRAARTSLKPGGVLACDVYGGSEAYTPKSYTKRVRGPAGERIDYTWRQEAADPVTARVVNTMTFRVRDKGAPRHRLLQDAFVYHWRLWTIAELREAMTEAGFASTEVYDRLGDAVDSEGRFYVRPMEEGQRLDDNYVVYVVGRTGRVSRRHRRR